MEFLITARFRADVETERSIIHEEFNEHLAQHRPRVRLAASMRSKEGGRSGIAIILDAIDADAASAFVAASPYQIAGLYQSVEIDNIDVEVGTLD